MTPKQLFANGVTKIRLPEWNEQAFLKISGTPEGLLHPWATLHDLGGIKKDVMIVGEIGTNWEKFSEDIL